jgi:hypothetical protein
MNNQKEPIHNIMDEQPEEPITNIIDETTRGTKS